MACGENWQAEVENAVHENNLGAARRLNTQVGYVTEAEELQKKIESILRIPHAILKQNQAAYQQELHRLGWWAKEPQYRPGQRLWAHMDIRKHARFSLIQYHLVRNLLYGLRQRGWDVRFNVMRDDHYYPWYYRLVDMNQFCPDAVLLFNEGACFETALGKQVCAELPVPKATWWTDNPVYCRHFFIRHGIPEGEFHTAADRAWVDFLGAMGAKSPAFLPGACTYQRFGRRSSELKCQISFVGQVRNHKPFLEALPQEWRDYAERVVEMKLRERFRPFEEVMDATEPPRHNLGEDRLDEIRQKLLWEANTRFRVAAIQALRGLDLRLYGNEQWLDFLQDEGLRTGFRGLIPYSRLPHLYRNSLVSLNIHSLQSTTCLNVRDFDVPMAGGFLVSDLLPESENLFELGFIEDLEAGQPRELICYRDSEELRRIVAFVAEHEEIRQACMAKARARIAKEHTYDHRADFLSGYIQKRL